MATRTSRKSSEPRGPESNPLAPRADSGGRSIYARAAVAAFAVFIVLGGVGQAATRVPAEGQTKTPFPKVWTTKASLVEPTTAWLTGVINPRGVPTFYRFQYGLTKSYGFVTAADPDATISKNKRWPAEAFVEGLRPGTTYHFRLVAIHNGGKTYGGDRTFTTATPKAAAPGTVIACFHEKVRRYTARVHPGRCNIRGYRGKQVLGVPIKGMKWGHWGFNPTRAAYGIDMRDGTRVRVIAYRPVTCDEGRSTWYSRVVVVFPGNGKFFGLRLPTCNDR